MSDSRITVVPARASTITSTISCVHDYLNYLDAIGGPDPLSSRGISDRPAAFNAACVRLSDLKLCENASYIRLYRVDGKKS